jgi:signal transduction histidine kinase
MAERVMVSSREALEIDAVVTEILANVAKHAGPAARAWVLLEHEGRELIISLRDNGVGAKAEDITKAGDRGHIGVRDSVLGRIRDLGGQAVVRAAPGRGVDWELRIPVQ